jgi:hypothetical protein
VDFPTLLAWHVIHVIQLQYRRKIPEEYGKDPGNKAGTDILRFGPGLYGRALNLSASRRFLVTGATFPMPALPMSKTQAPMSFGEILFSFPPLPLLPGIFCKGN